MITNLTPLERDLIDEINRLRAEINVLQGTILSQQWRRR